MDNILYVVDKTDLPLIVITICFFPLLMDRYNDRLLPLLRQLLFIRNRKNKFMDFIANCSTSFFN